MRIHSLALKNLEPFLEGTEIVFPAKPPHDGKSPELAEVQIIVGANGSGKTRLLSLLCAALGNPAELLLRGVLLPALDTAVVAEDNRGVLGVYTPLYNKVTWLPSSAKIKALDWCLASDAAEKLHAKADNSDTFTHSTIGKDSHDRHFALAFGGDVRLVDSADVKPLEPRALGKESDHLMLERFGDASLPILQNLINIYTKSSFSSPLAARWKAVREKLESTISTITGRSFVIGFDEHPEFHMDVFWGGVRMRIGQLPDGLRSILGWLAAVVAKLGAAFPDHPDPLAVPFVALIDEPENHLHPKWQRQIIPAAQRLFPNAQLIIATHSPFLVSSVNTGSIHILRVNDKTGKASNDPPAACGKADTYIEVVNEILGLTMNQRFDPETETNLNEFDRLRDLVLAGHWEHEDALVKLAESLWSRGSIIIENRVGRDLYTVDQARKASAAKPRTTATPARTKPPRTKLAKAALKA